MIESDTLAAVIEKHIKTAVDNSVEDYIEKTIAALTLDPAWVTKIENLVNQNFQRRFDQRLSAVDFNALINAHIDSGIERWQARLKQNFSTAGIRDQAISTQLVVDEDRITAANSLICASLQTETDAEIKGTLVVKNLSVRGTINTDNASWNELVQHIANAAVSEMTQQWRDQIADQVLAKAKTTGIDFDSITINGKPIVEAGVLNASILHSNLQQVGTLQDLRVAGDAVINSTLNVNTKRVGINTDAPEMALGLWDEEISMALGKHSLNHAFIGTTRAQTLSLGVNRLPCLDIDTDGTTIVKRLRINQHRIGFETQVPGYSGTRGDIVFNSDPRPGQPMAWQCLGGFKWQAIRATT